MTPNEETGRRFCMLSEFMFGKPVSESYKSLCSKIGDETISYQEFDFWFHRFAQGKLDLSYDRSLDPKPKELSDMPVDVIDNILDHLSLLERYVTLYKLLRLSILAQFFRLPVRNVSRNLRDLIDKRTTNVKKIYFTISPDSYFVSIDNICTNYRKSRKLKTSRWLYESYYGNPLTV
ncbi:hypothetical protein CAEBREN_09393 [Caenorhabditis brenneri]|uniref:Mos1 transposase HTH domain-containing protein n=1 Tax=Caenorhabditis brenneri TaxID=135651 RepID=G0P3E5_CAEBE|nr:hypothetical protein CAEBREN_09393 [Caenorhabditis brenneri]